MKVLQALLWTVAIGVCSACTFTGNYKLPVVEHSGIRQVPASIQLLLDEEYRTYLFTMVLGDTYEVPLGKNLSQNAQSLSEALFQEVVVVENTEGGKAPLPTLFPRVADIHQSRATWAGTKQTITISLEWRLLDDTDKVIWVTTVEGVGEGTMGNAFTIRSNQEKQFKRAVRAVFEASFERLSTAPEVRALGQDGTHD